MNQPPISEGGLSQSWANWFTQIFNAIRWSKSFNTSAQIDFPLIVGQQQETADVTVRGARPGDAVIVTPTIDVNWIVFTGFVSDADTVTVVAKNVASFNINPASQSFRIIVIQN